MTHLEAFPFLAVIVVILCVLVLSFWLRIHGTRSLSSRIKATRRSVRVITLERSKQKDLSCDHLQVGSIYTIAREYDSFYRVTNLRSGKFVPQIGFVAKDDVEVIEDS